MSTGAYRADIDGLRALAVFSVVAYHAGMPGFPGGFVGVDVFFVISGYLIGGIVWRGVQAGEFSLAAFYARRARRILPALFVTLLVSAAMACLLLTPTELLRFARGMACAVFAVSNIDAWHNTSYFSPDARLNPLLMSWTLGVEEQFYLLFPGLALLVWRYRPGSMRAIIAALCAVSLAICVWATKTLPNAAFFLLPARAWELGAGVWLAMLPAFPRRGGSWRGAAGIALLIAAIGGFGAGTPFPGYAATLPVCGAALVISAPDGWANRRLLASRPAVFVGLVSYSWYLWHWPLLSFARIAADRPLSLPVTGAIATMSFGVALLSWRFVETPFRRRSPNARILRRYAAAAAAMAVLALLLSADRGLAARFSPQLETIERQARLPVDRCLVSYGDRTPGAAPGCLPDAATTALLGDSHAAVLAAALRARLGPLVELTKASCPPLLGIGRLMPSHPAHLAECAAFNGAAIGAVAARPQVKTVVLAAYWSAGFTGEAAGERYARPGEAPSPAQSRADFQQGLAATRDALQAAGKRVVVLGDPPLFDFDPLRHVERGFIPARAWLGARLAPAGGVDERSAPFADVVDDPDPAGLRGAVDLLGPFCTQARCVFADAQGSFYADPQHLTRRGAEKAVGALPQTPPKASKPP